MFDKKKFAIEICKLNPGIIFYFYNDVWPVCFGKKDELILPCGWIKREGNTIYNIKDNISLKIIMLNDYVFPRPEDIIDKNDHYYLLMLPLKYSVSSYDGKDFMEREKKEVREKWVECAIVEDRYRVYDGCLIEFASLEEGYGNEVVSYDSFINSIKEGLIVKKEEGMECVLESFNEPLYKDLYLKHSGYVLKRVKDMEVRDEK